MDALRQNVCVRQNVCRQLKLRTMMVTLLGLPLPPEIKKIISEFAVPRVPSVSLLRVHNACYMFLNPTVRVIEEMDRW